MDKINKWESFSKEIANLFFFWIFGIIFFTIHRAVFILIYHKDLSEEATTSELLKAFAMGFRFDSTAVAYFMIVPIACTLLLSPLGYFNFIRIMRWVWQYLFVILSVFICVITLNYYKEYNDQFNMFLFLGIYDDQEAILKTIIEYYHPVLNTLAFMILSLSGILLFHYLSSKDKVSKLISKTSKKVFRVSLIIFIILCTVFTIRGSIINRPVTRGKAAVTNDKLLNKVIINPFRALIYATQDFNSLNQIGGSNPYGNDWSEDELTISSIIKKEATGSTIEKPKQVFLIVMESYSGWALLDKYQSFGVADNLKQIMKEGTYFPNFLPAYHSTIHAYTTLTTGIPYFGINTTKSAVNHEPYISSIFSHFNRLGYTTNTFYGGEFTWENFGVFTKHLECENVYKILEEYKTDQTGVWGVDDIEMLDVVLSKVDSTQYSFNLILTLSNHPPYEVDVYKHGFPYRTKEDLPQEAQKYYTEALTMKELGHFWYGDMALGRFMEEAKQKYPNALFAFTGDHYGRKFVNHHPNLYELSAVPFILYGKGIPAQKLDTPGSHVDIPATLIELVAPKDFTYYSFGESMLNENKNLGITFEKVIDRDTLYHAPRDAKVATISLQSLQESQSNEIVQKDRYNEMLKRAWQYVVKGDSIKSK